MRAHPLWDEYWESKALDFAAIEVPAFVVASWSDHGLHTRGTLECFKRMRSTHKWLPVHGQKKWAHYYAPENVERLRQFFDHFLRGASDPDSQRTRRVAQKTQGARRFSGNVTFRLSAGGA